MANTLRDRATMQETVPSSHVARRILVADDDSSALEGLRSLLELWGYEVKTASDGRAALEQVPKVHPAVVITDVVMPRLGGLDLLEAIRRQLPAVPVIVMTAHGTLETWRRATSHGAFA